MNLALSASALIALLLAAPAQAACPLEQPACGVDFTLVCEPTESGLLACLLDWESGEVTHLKLLADCAFADAQDGERLLRCPVESQAYTFAVVPIDVRWLELATVPSYPVAIAVMHTSSAAWTTETSHSPGRNCSDDALHVSSPSGDRIFGGEEGDDPVRYSEWWAQ